jgi:GT2 family glycosyltransferase
VITEKGENLIFLFGLPRSGTTLLSVMLNNHPAVRCPPEPWIMLALESLGRTSARSPADAPALYRAVRDFCDSQTAIEAARKYAGAMYNAHLAGSGKSIFVDKTPRYHLILPYLKSVFPLAKYLVLWRDPLDVALSMRKTWGHDIPNLLAKGRDHPGCIDLVLGLRVLRDLSRSDDVYSVHYESLVREPAKTWAALTSAIGLAPSEPAAEFDLSGTEFSASQFGDRNILGTSIPHQHSIGRWRDAFTREEIQTLVDALGPGLLSDVGYADVLTEAAKIGVVVAGEERAELHARRLTEFLNRRRTEYDNVWTYCELMIHEANLREALNAGSSNDPAFLDLSSNIRVYADAARAMIQSHKESEDAGDIGLPAGQDGKPQGRSTDGAATLLNRLRAGPDALRVARTTLPAFPPNRRAWPYEAPESEPLPLTLPGGKPWPRISIVTPSFNQGVYIEQTILSVLNQNYPNFEYLLIDGQSTDQTMSIVNAYRDRIHLVVSEKDRGQSHAINKGMALAAGDLLTWLNSDDMLEPGALAAMAMAFATSGADMVAGVCTVHDGGKIVCRHITSCADGPLPVNDLLDLDGCWLRGQFFHQPEVMFTRDLWRRAGSYVDEKLFYSMDYELWLRFAQNGAKLHSIGKSVCLYRTHRQQKTFDPAEYIPELRGVRDDFLKRSGKAAPKRAATLNPKSALRIVFFNDVGGVAGAGIGHQRLATAVATAGMEVVSLAIQPALVSSKLTNQQVIDAVAKHQPDLVVVGNIHAAQLDPGIAGLLAERWPTVQVLHDLYALTGRCAYMGDCTKYLAGCDQSCPTPYEYPALEPELIRAAWDAKQCSLTGDSPPILAGVSAWSEQLARRRFAGPPAPRRSPEIISIRLGLPMDLFKPRDKSTCRDLLGLPQDRFIILFSSSHLGDKRKGFDHLIKALNLCKLPHLLAVCAGELQPALKHPDFEIQSMGYIGDMHALALLYSACDLYAGPSLLETFGQVFIEAAACGTPSVGYASAGGVAEAILDGFSGKLTPHPCAEELAHTIRSLFNAPSLRSNMAVWGRLWVENEHSFFASHQRLFSQLNRMGLIRQLGAAPKITFLRETAPDPTVIYLESSSEPAPAAASANRVGSVVQLRSRVASLEAERDSLRMAVHSVTHTRLWRMVETTYPMYQRVINSRAIPMVVRKAVHATGQWLAHRSNHSKP